MVSIRKTFSHFLLLVAILFSIQIYVLLSRQTNEQIDRLARIEIDEIGSSSSSKNNTDHYFSKEDGLATALPPKNNIVHRLTLPHGRFTFWRNSHELDLPRKDDTSSWMTTDQENLLFSNYNGDGTSTTKFDLDNERKRCASYGFSLHTKPSKLRRLFLGSLIADDSLEVLKAIAMEVYDLFHTVSFVESNVSVNLSPRVWRYIEIEGEEGEHPSRDVYELFQLFGPNTKVSVDYYVTSRTNINDVTGGIILHESLQKEGIIHRWKLNGMGPDDVGIIADADEVFTRDFLKALQICNIPQFEHGQSCDAPKLLGSTLVFESSPECIATGDHVATKIRRWHHPDAIIGECIDLIGNSTQHPPPMRKWLPNEKEQNITKRIEQSHGARLRGYGGTHDYSLYELVYGPKLYPLWSAGDFRVESGGKSVRMDGQGTTEGWTGYHFHNFFSTSSEIHWKYSTYGHADLYMTGKPIWELHEDLEMGVRCAKGSNSWRKISRWLYGGFESTLKGMRPIYYLNKEVRDKRHLVWQRIVKEEEERHNSQGSNYSI